MYDSRSHMHVFKGPCHRSTIGAPAWEIGAAIGAAHLLGKSPTSASLAWPGLRACVQVFLLSTRAGGAGLNLIGGNHLVLFDPGEHMRIPLGGCLACLLACLLACSLGRCSLARSLACLLDCLIASLLACLLAWGEGWGVERQTLRALAASQASLVVRLLRWLCFLPAALAGQLVGSAAVRAAVQRSALLCVGFGCGPPSTFAGKRRCAVCVCPRMRACACAVLQTGTPGPTSRVSCSCRASAGLGPERACVARTRHRTVAATSHALCQLRAQGHGPCTVHAPRRPAPAGVDGLRIMSARGLNTA